MNENTLNENPWLNGPFELIHHAISHYHKNTPVDLRFSMIHTDNCVELGMKLYLTMVLRLHDGNKDFLQADRSFYKLLSLSCDKLEIDNAIRSNIEYCHKLRNNLYHDGNGISVENLVVKRYIKIATYLLKKMYDLDIEFANPLESIELKDPIFKLTKNMPSDSLINLLLEIEFDDKYISYLYEERSLYQFIIAYYREILIWRYHDTYRRIGGIYTISYDDIIPYDDTGKEYDLLLYDDIFNDKYYVGVKIKTLRYENQIEKILKQYNHCLNSTNKLNELMPSTKHSFKFHIINLTPELSQDIKNLKISENVEFHEDTINYCMNNKIEVDACKKFITYVERYVRIIEKEEQNFP